MSAKWRKSREGRIWHRQYMREYMRRRRSNGEVTALEVVTPGEPAAAVAMVAQVHRPARSLLSVVKRDAVWPDEEITSMPAPTVGPIAIAFESAESITEKYKRDIRKPKEQKPVFTNDQIIQ